MDSDVVYYFKCERCSSEVFWSEIKPSVQRAARVFKWVRAGCPHRDCANYLILSDPNKIYGKSEALELYNKKKQENEETVYWI
jgi:hypothetical protein